MIAGTPLPTPGGHAASLLNSPSGSSGNPLLDAYASQYAAIMAAGYAATGNTQTTSAATAALAGTAPISCSAPMSGINDISAMQPTGSYKCPD